MRSIFLIALCIAGTLYAKPLELTVTADEAILINAKTGRILFAKNEHQQVYPASTTKIATAVYALHKCAANLECTFAADRESVASISPQAKKQSNYRSPPHWLETDGTHVGIKRGEEMQFKDLLHAMLIASANDASNVIAQNVGGTIPTFMEELNLYLKKIGCKNTHFNNPHGLHHPSHVTTAYDLSIMAKEGLKNPLFREVVSTVRYTFPKTNLEQERHLVQTNHLLKKGTFYYPKAIGVKTGFTQTAGKNLVAAAEDEDRILIAVALGYKGPRSELYLDIIKMFDAAFNEPKMRRTLLTKGEQKLTTTVSGSKKRLKTYLADNVSYDFYPSEEIAVKASVSWNLPELPIAKDTAVGVIKLIDPQGNILNQHTLFAVDEIKPTLWRQIKDFSAEPKIRKVLFALAIGLVILVCWRLLRKNKRSRLSS